MPPSFRQYGPRRFRLGNIEMPITIAVLIGLNIVATLGAWLLDHTPHPATPWVMFTGEQVWQGEVWRLFSYVFVAMDPWSFLFGILLIYWFGKPLCDDWGARRFVLVYLGLAAAAGLIVALVGRFLWPPANVYPHLGNMPVVDAVTVLWALRYPTQEIRFYFLFPMRGRVLIYATVIITAVYAARFGLSAMLPHFAAEALALASGLDMRTVWLRYKQTRLKKQMRRYVDNVRRIDGSDDEDEPPPRKWVN